MVDEKKTLHKSAARPKPKVKNKRAGRPGKKKSAVRVIASAFVEAIAETRAQAAQKKEAADNSGAVNKKASVNKANENQTKKALNNGRSSGRTGKALKKGSKKGGSGLINRRYLTVGAALAVLMIGCILFGILHRNREPEIIPLTEMEMKPYELSVYEAGGKLTFPKGIYLEGESMYGKTLDDVQAVVDQYVKERKDRAITFTASGTDVYNYNGDMLGVAWTNTDLPDQMRNYLPSEGFVGQYKKQKDYEASPIDFQIETSCDEDTVGWVVRSVCSKYSTPMTNASCELIDGTMVARAGEDGFGFDTQAILAKCMELINDPDNTDLIEYDFQGSVIKQQCTAADFSFTWSVLGEYSTSNLGEENRLYNIQLSADRLDGTVVLPGEQKHLMGGLYGDVSLDGGYLEAPTYNDGKQEDALSGGICQTTTTLYNALLRAEMQIDSRNSHSMLVSYVPPSMDAMVSVGGSDFAFTNSSSSPIYIQAFINEDTLTIRIYGKEDREAGRTIAFETEILELYWPDPLYNDNVDDEKAVYGRGTIDEKARAVVETHPYVKSKSYKIVRVNGVEKSRTLLTEDAYNDMPGEMFHSSDCQVENEIIEQPGGVYQYLDKGYDVYHKVTDLQGNDWGSIEGQL